MIKRNYFTIDELEEHWKRFKLCRADIEWYLETRKLDAEYYQYPANSSKPEFFDSEHETEVRRFLMHPFPYGKWPKGEIRITKEEVERFEKECADTLAAIAPTKESTRAIETLQKALVAVAMDCYGYNPTSKANTAIKDIQTALDNIGLTLSENTIRAHLKAGAQLIPREEAIKHQ